MQSRRVSSIIQVQFHDHDAYVKLPTFAILFKKSSAARHRNLNRKVETSKNNGEAIFDFWGDTGAGSIALSHCHTERLTVYQAVGLAENLHMIPYAARYAATKASENRVICKLRLDTPQQKQEEWCDSELAWICKKGS